MELVHQIFLTISMLPEMLVSRKWPLRDTQVDPQKIGDIAKAFDPQYGLLVSSRVWHTYIYYMLCKQ
jgi:hypothetical protein